MKKKIVLVFLMILIGTSSAFAVPFGFSDVPSDDNIGLDLSANFSGEVIDYGLNQVMFIISNNGPDVSTIASIFFEYNPDDLLSQGAFNTGNSSTGVFFGGLGNLNLPQGNNLSFDADFGMDADNPKPQNGVNVGEYAAFLFDGNFDEVLFAMTQDYLRIGMHVINIGELSDSYVSGPPTNPVPEPATLFLMGIGLLGLSGFSRKRYNKTNRYLYIENLNER